MAAPVGVAEVAEPPPVEVAVAAGAEISDAALFNTLAAALRNEESSDDGRLEM